MTLLFMEAKRASAYPSDIINVETQAYTAACAYAVDMDSKDPIWTMTCVGSTFRLWIFDWEQVFLVPYFPATYGESKSDYIEISQRGTELLQHLNFIKRYPTPPPGLIGQSSPRPLNAALPDHWHNDEVILRDAQHQNVRHHQPIPAIGHPGEAEMIGTADEETGYDPGRPGTDANPTATTSISTYDQGENVHETGSTSTPFPEGSAVTRNPNAASAQKWSRIELRKKRHLTKPTEYLFTTDKGHERSTEADDWREARHKGKQAWYYLHKGTKYYTRERPGA